MVHDAVNDGGGHLVVAGDLAPARELEVRRDHHRLPLEGLRDHLEQKPGAVRVERREAELVHNQQGGPADLGELPVEPALVARAPRAPGPAGSSPGSPRRSRRTLFSWPEYGLQYRLEQR